MKTKSYVWRTYATKKPSPMLPVLIVVALRPLGRCHSMNNTLESKMLAFVKKIEIRSFKGVKSCHHESYQYCGDSSNGESVVECVFWDCFKSNDSRSAFNWSGYKWIQIIML
ncbi:hypothetical protein Hdeb2414_s0022g00617921 [Helianthus debilis subsp. tardiflorus]